MREPRQDLPHRQRADADDRVAELAPAGRRRRLGGDSRRRQQLGRRPSGEESPGRLQEAAAGGRGARGVDGDSGGDDMSDLRSKGERMITSAPLMYDAGLADANLRASSPSSPARQDARDAQEEQSSPLCSWRTSDLADLRNSELSRAIFRGEEVRESS